MKTTTDNHIDKVLHEAMKRRAEKVPPLAEDFAEKVMKRTTGLTPSSLTPSPSPRRGETSGREAFLLGGRFGWGIGGLIAAGIALLIALHYNNKVEPTEQPVVAEVVKPENPQPAPEPVVEEKQEPQTPQPPAQPVRPKKRAKTQEPAEEPLLAEAETVEGAPVEMICQDVLGNTREPSSTFATQTQEIRQRGEQVIQYVAMLNQQIKTEQHYIEY